MRKWKTLAASLLLVTVLACSGTVPRSQLASNGPQISSELRQIVDSAKIPELRWPDFANLSASVRTVYERNSFNPLWFTAGELSHKGQEILAALESSTAKGLDPEEYDLQRLSRWAQQLRTSSPVERERSATLDVALTVDLMRYAAALHQGRIDPRQVRFAIRSKDCLDPAGFVLKYLHGEQSLPEALTQIEPSFNGYRKTLAALVHYQQLASQEPSRIPVQPRLPLRPGQTYTDLPVIAARLESLGDLIPISPESARSDLYDGRVQEAVKSFQIRHGLPSTGIIDLATWKALTTPLSERVEQLALTLERWRWIPSSVAPAIVVNIPEFELRAFDEKGKLVLRMHVIVGKAYRRKTPVFEDRLEGIILRPAWTVPLSIQRGEMVPKIRADPNYLRANDLEIVDRDDQPVPWDQQEPLTSRLASGDLRLRQRPGPENSLGLIKFDFPNDYSVYMHGTPARQLFSRARRDFSHGCIRLENPEWLAEWVLRDDPGWDRAKIAAACNADRTLRIPLRRPLAVLVLYGTAIVEENGEVRFFDDIYGYDAELRKALAARKRSGTSCP